MRKYLTGHCTLCTVLPNLLPLGYINEGGTLHMERFETYLKALAEFDYSFHEELLGGLKWMEGKRRRGKETADKTKRKSKEKNGGSSEESLSPEENGMTSSTEQTSSKDAGVFPTGLADIPAGLAGFMCGVDDESVEVDESSEAVVKLKVGENGVLCASLRMLFTCTYLREFMIKLSAGWM